MAVNCVKVKDSHVNGLFDIIINNTVIEFGLN